MVVGIGRQPAAVGHHGHAPIRRGARERLDQPAGRDLVEPDGAVAARRGDEAPVRGEGDLADQVPVIAQGVHQPAGCRIPEDHRAGDDHMALDSRSTGRRRRRWRSISRRGSRRPTRPRRLRRR